jgi:hypothetical protein
LGGEHGPLCRVRPRRTGATGEQGGRQGSTQSQGSPMASGARTQDSDREPEIPGPLQASPHLEFGQRKVTFLAGSAILPPGQDRGPAVRPMLNWELGREGQRPRWCHPTPRAPRSLPVLAPAVTQSQSSQAGNLTPEFGVFRRRRLASDEGGVPTPGTSCGTRPLLRPQPGPVPPSGCPPRGHGQGQALWHPVPSWRPEVELDRVINPGPWKRPLVSPTMCLSRHP